MLASETGITITIANTDDLCRVKQKAAKKRKFQVIVVQCAPEYQVSVSCIHDFTVF